MKKSYMYPMVTIDNVIYPMSYICGATKIDGEPDKNPFGAPERLRKLYV